jgi:riboflavin kinase/FMN adenylyltransferase
MKNFFVVQGEGPNPLAGRPQVLVIGNFDGVHLGHQALLRKAREVADAQGLPAVVLTFDPHPMAILRPPHLRLFDLEDQQAQFRKAGMDGVVYLSFSRDFSELPAERFLERVLEPGFHPKAIVVGFNFRFGAGRTGDTETLKQWGARNGCDVHVVEPFRTADGVVSTSEVRKSLQAGDVARAARLLGRPYFLSGIVVRGAERGRGLGFPTANLHLEKVVTPAWGVYATRTLVQGRLVNSVSHLGPLPTFGDEAVRLETHLLDFTGHLYGETLQVNFIDRIRGVEKFNSIEELRAQILRDVERGRELLGERR